MRDTFSDKTRQMAYEAYNGYCAVDGCCSKSVDYHHCLPNTKYHKEKYKFFLQSVFNCRPVCRDCHEQRAARYFRISDQVAEMYEQYLRSIWFNKAMGNQLDHEGDYK